MDLFGWLSSPYGCLRGLFFAVYSAQHLVWSVNTIVITIQEQKIHSQNSDTVENMG